MISLINASSIAQDDKDFMLRLYQEFKPLMFATARKYVSNISDCEDIVQDCIVKLIEKIDTLREKDRCSLCSYIVFTVRNTAINFLKRQGIINAHFSSLDLQYDELESKEPSLDELMALAERRAKLSDVWDQLPEEDRTLLEGKYILGYADKELAAQLNCNPSSIRMKLTRARRKALKLLISNSEVDYDKT